VSWRRIILVILGGIAVIVLSFWITLTILRNRPPPGRGPCYFDAEKLCPGVQPGEGRILQCLSRQMDKQISDACRKAVEDYLKR
jgi:hypothetical protein